MLKCYVIMLALCSIHKTMHNARYNARLICAGLSVAKFYHNTYGYPFYLRMFYTNVNYFETFWSKRPVGLSLPQTYRVIRL